MSYEIKDSRFPYCVLQVVSENNTVVVEFRGTSILVEYITLIDSILSERLLIPYSMNYNALTGHLQLTYW